MLSKVLSKNTCADCKFCCSFRRCSLWETPLFSKETMDKLEKLNEYNRKADFDKKILTVAKNESGNAVNAAGEKEYEYGQMKLEYKYKTDDSEEEAACEFLDPHKGCVLSPEDKPFDCKIWPLRIMKKDDKVVIAFTPTCPVLGKVPSEDMKKLVNDGLGQTIYEYAKEHPYIIKEYKEGFPILMERELV